MKTDKFKDKWTKMHHGVVKQDGDALSLTTTDEDEEETVPFEINTKNSFVEFGYTGGYLSVAQLKLITEYLETPIPQREEEKKYYVKAPDSCPYCHNAPRQKNLILTPTEDSFIRIVYMEGNKLVLEDRNMIKKVKIKYCPMCGRKL